MSYVLFLFLIFILLIDVLFYIPIKIHFYYDNNCFYLYVFSISILHIDNDKTINRLVNKIDIKGMNKNKNDINIIKAFKVKKVKISVKENLAYSKPYIFYSLFALNAADNVSYQINNKNAIYVKIEVVLIKCLLELIKQRSYKNERTSNK